MKTLLKTIFKPFSKPYEKLPKVLTKTLSRKIRSTNHPPCPLWRHLESSFKNSSRGFGLNGALLGLSGAFQRLSEAVWGSVKHLWVQWGVFGLSGEHPEHGHNFTNPSRVFGAEWGRPISNASRLSVTSHSALSTGWARSHPSHKHAL